MLGGCLAVTNSLSWNPVRLERVLMLALTINVYEFLLVGLGLMLLKRPRSQRDGSILLALEAFFVVDVAFLNAELFAIDRWVGLLANVLLFALAVVKLGMIGRAIGLPLSDRRLVLAAGQILAIYALPGVLKFYATYNGGTLPALAMLMVWWTLFAIGAAGYSLWMQERSRDNAVPAIAAWFVPLLTVASGVSLLAHAATSQWIYDLRFWGADLAPMLVLAAFILCSRASTRSAGLLCAVASLFATTSYGPALRMTAFGFQATPVHVTWTILYLVLAWTLARHLFARLVAIGAAAGLIVAFGPSVATVRQWLSALVGRADDAVEVVRPKTMTHYGLISIGLSFALLALGVLFSLRKDPNPPVSERTT